MSAPWFAIDELATRVTGRATSRFADDLRAHGAAVTAAVRHRRVLVTGGAGSLGAATVRELLRHEPATIVLVDHDENGLVELLRDLRSDPATCAADVRPLPLDFGSSVLRQYLHAEPPFDLVLHFAAAKHVRSERDRASLLHLLDTNLCKVQRLLAALAERGFVGRCFGVSTDKAAEPVNVMGASKRLMETLLLRDGALPGAAVTSARFANVAFSAGSLLQGFLWRLAKRQPLAVPRDTWRYLVTPREAGELCLLAATVAPGGHVVVPRLHADRDMVRLEDVATMVVEAHGHRPRFYEDEAAARSSCRRDFAAGEWPIVRTALDTAGEKVSETFVAVGEQPREIGFLALQGIAAAPGPAAAAAALVRSFAEEVAAPTAGRSKQQLIDAMQAVVPGFVHRASERTLDQRM